MCPHIPWLHGILRSEPKQTSCRHWTVFLLTSLIPWGVARLARPRMEIISACSCVLTYRSALGSVLCIPWSGEAALWKWSCERCCETALAAEQADELLLQQGRTWGLSRACVLRPYGRAFKSIIICLLHYLFATAVWLPLPLWTCFFWHVATAFIYPDTESKEHSRIFCCRVGRFMGENFPWVMSEKNLYLLRFFV